MKKLSLTLTLLAPALLLTPLRGQTFIETTDENRVGGNVSAVNISLVINETIGGYRISDAQRAAATARGIEYPTTITYNNYIGSPSSAILNPVDWNQPTVNNYVEQSTNRLGADGTRVITADGRNVTARTRYTNANLLADLAAAFPDRIPNPRGYRIVAVRFDIPVPEVVYNNGTYATVVREGLYFFAENPAAPSAAPVFLGAETNVYAFDPFIDFSSYETAETGRYVETFTQPQGAPGFDYRLLSDSFSGIALAEFSVYRRRGAQAATNYYEMRVGGVFTWSEVYDTRRVETGTYNRGAITGRTLAGPGISYVSGQPTEANEAVVTGAISLPAATYRAKGTLLNYLNAIPPQASNP